MEHDEAQEEIRREKEEEGLAFRPEVKEWPEIKAAPFLSRRV